MAEPNYAIIDPDTALENRIISLFEINNTMNLPDVIQALAKQEAEFPNSLYIRQCIWRLIIKGILELNNDRTMTLNKV